jgi:hypothetical protein
MAPRQRLILIASTTMLEPGCLLDATLGPGGLKVEVGVIARARDFDVRRRRALPANQFPNRNRKAARLLGGVG